ncbi:MAG: DUF2156 domain-containing protein [Syntrophaceae bacterium]|nr:DUF2156 domain-containing protein [Syntrophaceae bacterium]
MEELWDAVPEFPQVKDLSLDEKPLFDTLFNLFPPVISEYTFTNLFIWRHAYQLRTSRFKKFLLLLSDRGENSFFFPPIGEGDVLECFHMLLQYLEERGIPPKVGRVPESLIAGMDWKGAGLVIEFDQAQSDYVYLTEDLIKLEGRKYHRKRNHIKQFRESFPFQYIPLIPEWISECLRLQTEWCDLRHCEAVPGLLNESLAIKEAFSHFEDLGLKGGAILINGRVEAFTLGEPLNPETVVIHIEKANPAFDGIYPTINQAFLQNEWSGYPYVNREQDLGEEGLRKAKESYFPHHMVKKYIITKG